VRPDLHIDWATHKAATFACERWHYSKCLPVGKLIKIGAWEDEKFIGCVIFGRGANRNMLNPYGLEQTQGCELVRIALTEHKAPVSKIMAHALRMLKQREQIELVVSYADPEAGHHGGVYQAANWTYVGTSAKSVKVFWKGKWRHKKTVDDAGICQKNLKKRTAEGKHTYLMPLTKRMKSKIQGLARPYPKRVQSIESDASGNQSEEGGAIPTCTLQHGLLPI